MSQQEIVLEDENKEIKPPPYGLLVWATGNKSRPLARKLMEKLPDKQTQKRGLLVDDHLRLLGTDGIYAVGDATATKYAPTAQVAAQQGKYLASVFAALAPQEAANKAHSNSNADDNKKSSSQQPKLTNRSTTRTKDL
ncbi:uncharacterized protein SPPG_09206 [Spizellomyces punctatus DAOM BR117]|uniref:NADH:ubiquinone reductase (non-electrogenic) n=1 Tax=Spizellomyces punctatus (strain DAOM BR117) TaxID=645134 RepID=A0A0L0HGR1_SPIPD|nr:uncharacterized protein SPPG_09206 [Spizellomyces punctatus DAOM BR117]KND00257.1 hypothetical protein SPPG_09206 [Spizellomyces punctatus DAOM BR117]|eukprot:XP_016608296.1 hypothetical protein SPPG_09206 [Spizellomyces punctatus DAOM BR117]